MHYNGPVVRPPHEASSILLEVTTGCTHNSCTFCTFYKGVPFHMSSWQQIEEDLQESAHFRPKARRVWLTGGDPFTLRTDLLEKLALLVRKYQPAANIATYARVDSFFHKSVEDLKKLHTLGYNDLVIGIESGDDRTLRAVNKGYTAADVLRECKKLEAAGIRYYIIYLGGIAGAGRCEANALQTAAVFNQLHPYFMYLTTVTLFPDSQMYRDVQQGKFQEASEKERIQEFYTLLTHLTIPLKVDARSISNPIHFYLELPRDLPAFKQQTGSLLRNFTAQEEKALRRQRRMQQII